MVKYLEDLVTASKIVLGSSKYLILFSIISIAFFAFYIIYPVFSIPGNDLFFQLSITPWWAFLAFTVLSVGVGLLMSMQVFHYKMSKSLAVGEAGSGLLGAMSGFVGSLFASATCAACIGTFLSFLSVGSIAFLLEYQYVIVAVSIVIVAISLFFTARKVNGTCEACDVNYKPKK